MNDKPEMSLMLIADTIIGSPNAGGILYIRCRGGKTEAYVVTGSANNRGMPVGSVAVRLRFDRNQPTDEVWSESSDYQALFSPQPIAFARHLLSTDTLRFQFDPFSGGSAVLRFDVRDLAPHLDSIATMCGWAAADSARKRAEAAREVAARRSATAEKRFADSVHKAFIAEQEVDKRFPFIAEEGGVLYYSVYCTAIPGIPKGRERRFRSREEAEAAGFKRSLTEGC